MTRPFFENKAFRDEVLSKIKLGQAAWPARRADPRDPLPRLRRLVADDRFGACPRRRLDGRLNGATNATGTQTRTMMNLRSLVLAFATALIAALPAAAESQAPDRLQTILDRGVLRVGTTMDTPVFSMRDPATRQAPRPRHGCAGNTELFARRQARIREDDVRLDARRSRRRQVRHRNVRNRPDARPCAGRHLFKAVHALREVAVDPQRRPGALQDAGGPRPPRGSRSPTTGAG